jgi:cytochrome c peroxidase
MKASHVGSRVAAVGVWLAVAACGKAPGASGTSGDPADLADLAPKGGAAAGSRVAARNRDGVALTVNVTGAPVVDPDGPFSRALGTNGRSCATCHVPEAGMAITPPLVRRAFDESDGTAPIFRTNDGATSPAADVSTVEARRRAYALLLDRALIRVGLPTPAGAEFSLAGVEDPYGFASATELSLFRRPLPAANLAFLSTVMWDGRETFRCAPGLPCSDAGGQSTGFATVHFDLADQANGATLGHAQAAAPLGDAEREAIVAHESALFTAQIVDDDAGRLDADGAQGGPLALSQQPFRFGVNDTFGAFGETFTPDAMTLFDAWADARGERGERRAAIARGQALFDRRTFTISGVGGLNDALGHDLEGTCTTCHDTPNAGDHSVPAPLRIGVDEPRPAGGLDATGLPVYTLRNDATGALVRTTDPGRALVTGRWADVGKFKGPVLRALASRPPYFHNGSARTLADVVRFYDERFAIGLTAAERADLVAFLSAL